MKNRLVFLPPWLWLAAVLAALAVPAAAQDLRVSILETVTDGSGANVFDPGSTHSGLTDQDRSSPRDIHLAVRLTF